MLTLTYGQLRDENFKRGIMRLGSCGLFKSPKLAFNVAKTAGWYDKEIETSDDVFKKLVNIYAVKDDKGNVVPHQGIPGTFFVEEKKEEWEEKLAEFKAIAVELDRPQLVLEEVIIAGLTPLEINALEPLLKFDDSLAEPRKLAKA